jgi:thermolysin
MSRFLRGGLALAAILVACATLRPIAQGGPKMTRVSADDGPELSRWNATVQRMITRGELREARVDADGQIPGREHVRFNQAIGGVPVFGGTVALQRDDRDVYSVNGLVYEDLTVETTPRLQADRAVNAALADVGQRAVLEERRAPSLIVLPLDEGGAALCYTFHVRTRGDRIRYLVDAHTGAVRLKYSDLWRQSSAVGNATGTWSDRKKLSGQNTGATFRADDDLRPADIKTFDMKGRGYLLNLLGGSLLVSDIAVDSDNNWTDGAVVDAHVYAGLTHDWFFKLFGRRSLDNRNHPLFSLVHNISRTNPDFRDPEINGSFGNNAFWDGQWMWYGEGDGITETFNSSALDIVAHELTHGFTQYSSDLIYQNESGALNESISDIFGVAVEFYFEPTGSGRKQAEWLLGEDATVDFARMLADPAYDRPVRSLADPRTRFQPDHYGIRFIGTQDNGGVHINSGISNNAFYLFVQGGRHRTSGLQVDGIGLANLERAVQIFYRAFAFFLPSNARFTDARRLTLQAARELYGAGSREEAQLTAAWNAVGVN